MHYTSPSIAGGLRVRAVYASGERDVSTATVNKNGAGNVMGLGASYASGPLSLQAYLHDIKNNAGNSDRRCRPGRRLPLRHLPCACRLLRR